MKIGTYERMSGIKGGKIYLSFLFVNFREKMRLIIFSQRMAGYLLISGFVLQGIEKSADGSRNVFIFNDSDPIKRKMDEYKNFKTKLEDCLK